MIEVQLVDAQDQPTGVMEKIEAHRMGLLHRALSVIIFNSKKEILLERRALGKYHSPGLCESDENPHLNPEEAMDFTWISIADLKKNMTEDPNSYTYWFKLIIETYGDSLKNYY